MNSYRCSTAAIPGSFNYAYNDFNASAPCFVTESTPTLAPITFFG